MKTDASIGSHAGIALMADLAPRLKERIEIAEEKHPQVASCVLWRSTDLATKHFASFLKARSKETDSVEDALLSEVHEYLFELNKDDNDDRAFDEMLDVCTVAIRAYLARRNLKKVPAYIKQEE